MRQVFLDTLDLAGQLVERALVGLVRNQRLALRNSLPNGLRLGIGDGFLSCRSRFGGLIGGSNLSTAILAAAVLALGLLAGCAAPLPAPSAPVRDVAGDLVPENDEQAAVLAFVDRIDIHNSETVLKYGNAAQTKISQFSDKILEDVKTKDTGAISDMLTQLVAELKGFDVDEGKKGGLFGLFKKAGSNIAQLRAKYDKVEENVAQIIATLQGHQKQLISDCKMLDELYAQNEQYYHELTLYIIAGELKLQRLREEELPPLLAKAQQTADPADAQIANDFSQLISRFEKRIHDLKLTRMVSVQMGPQIRLMQNNDNVLAERIQSTVANTIPLWKSQMAAALGLARATDSLTMQRRVGEQAARDVRRGARELAEQTKAYAAADADSDRQRAQQTAESLLAELADIEQSLSEQEKIRRAEQSAERGV